MAVVCSVEHDNNVLGGERRSLVGCEVVKQHDVCVFVEVFGKCVREVKELRAGREFGALGECEAVKVE